MSFDFNNLPSSAELKIALDRIECNPQKGGLANFVKKAWPILEPSTPLTWGKVLDVMCHELEEFILTPKYQPRKLFNVPPGTMKSMLVSVMFPAWIWTFKPDHSITGVAHEQGIAIRDARKMRLLVESAWYQARWPLLMSSDANAKTFFENEKMGFRQAVAFGSLTGRRSSLLLIDDPLSAEDAHSEAKREEAARIFTETVPTRVNNDNSAILIIMQRLHMNDVSGIILDEPDHFGYEPIVFPMRFEKEGACSKDWRTEEGELLFPERFPEETVRRLEKMLKEFGTASQLQQRPVPRDGGLFKRDWLKITDKVPNDVVWCRGYDLAASTKSTADRTSATKIGITPDKRVIIAHNYADRLSPNDVRALMKKFAEMDGDSVRISIPKDPGAAGLGQVEIFRQDLFGYDVRFSPETGDKVTRATPLAAQAEAGAVYLVRGDWNSDFIDELCNFPAGKHDDRVDSASRAFNEVMTMVRDTKKPKVSIYGGMVI